jgi:hypothetical protein
MKSVFVSVEAGILTSYSVGTLDEREAMMVVEFARTPEDLVFGARYKLPLAMSAELAKGLGEALQLAAETVAMGPCRTHAEN